MSNRAFRIYGPRGMVERAVDETERTLSRARTNAEDVSITQIMSRRVVCALPDLPLATLIDLMVGERLGSVPVIDERVYPLGMVTKWDIVEQLVLPRPPAELVVADVMMPLAITLGDTATVAHAAALMATEDMHHVMVVSERRLVGVVSTMDVTRWLANGGPS